VWKIEGALWPLLELCVQLLSEQPLFFCVNSYTTGLAPGAMGYMLGALLPGRFGGEARFSEIGLPVKATGGALPCGATALWTQVPYQQTIP
jgi:23S rRNA (cytosine1962-C5)-methyltransferase